MINHNYSKIKVFVYIIYVCVYIYYVYINTHKCMFQKNIFIYEICLFIIQII